MNTPRDALPPADHVFDGGDRDCGSGLILLIRQHMMQVPVGGVLELLSREPTVTTELPPWCRMVGHTHLASDEFAPGQWRHRVRHGSDSVQEQTDLQLDKRQAQAFQWSVRARQTEPFRTSVYARNFSWKSGPTLDFDKSGAEPSSLEQLLGALLTDVMNSFTSRCQRDSLTLDELEGTVKSTLVSPLAAIGVESGDPSLESIALVVYATSAATQESLRRCWDEGLASSPLYQTLGKAVAIETRLALL